MPLWTWEEIKECYTQLYQGVEGVSGQPAVCRMLHGTATICLGGWNLHLMECGGASGACHVVE